MVQQPWRSFGICNGQSLKKGVSIRLATYPSHAVPCSNRLGGAQPWSIICCSSLEMTGCLAHYVCQCNLRRRGSYGLRLRHRHRGTWPLAAASAISSHPARSLPTPQCDCPPAPSSRPQLVISLCAYQTTIRNRDYRSSEHLPRVVRGFECSQRQYRRQTAPRFEDSQSTVRCFFTLAAGLSIATPDDATQLT